MKSLRFTSHVFDIFTIPFFVLLFFYFYEIKNKTPIEWILYVFSIIGGVGYIIFTILFVKRHGFVKM
jgi:hypothetical protein